MPTQLPQKAQLLTSIFKLLRRADLRLRLTCRCNTGIVFQQKLMNWQERIVADPRVLVGKPVIKNTRIAVEFVIDLLARGWTTQQVLEEYDHLVIEDIQAFLAYAREVLESERVYPAQASTRKPCGYW